MRNHLIRGRAIDVTPIIAALDGVGLPLANERKTPSARSTTSGRILRILRSKTIAPVSSTAQGPSRFGGHPSWAENCYLRSSAAEIHDRFPLPLWYAIFASASSARRDASLRWYAAAGASNALAVLAQQGGRTCQVTGGYPPPSGRESSHRFATRAQRGCSSDECPDAPGRKIASRFRGSTYLRPQPATSSSTARLTSPRHTVAPDAEPTWNASGSDTIQGNQLVIFISHVSWSTLRAQRR